MPIIKINEFENYTLKISATFLGDKNYGILKTASSFEMIQYYIIIPKFNSILSHNSSI